MWHCEWHFIPTSLCLAISNGVGITDYYLLLWMPVAIIRIKCPWQCGSTLTTHYSLRADGRMHPMKVRNTVIISTILLFVILKSDTNKHVFGVFSRTNSLQCLARCRDMCVSKYGGNNSKVEIRLKSRVIGDNGWVGALWLPLSREFQMLLNHTTDVISLILNHIFSTTATLCQQDKKRGKVFTFIRATSYALLQIFRKLVRQKWKWARSGLRCWNEPPPQRNMWYFKQ